MVTREELLATARLAKLSVAEDQVDDLVRDMTHIMAYADTVRETSVNETSGGTSMAFATLRDDVTTPSCQRMDVLHDLPGGETGFFVIGEVSRPGGC